MDLSRVPLQDLASGSTARNSMTSNFLSNSPPSRRQSGFSLFYESLLKAKNLPKD